MSTLDEKLEQYPTTSQGNARATLAQLIKRWGSPKDLDPDKPPLLMVVRAIGDRETWRAVGGKGPGTVYELVERLPLKVGA